MPSGLTRRQVLGGATAGLVAAACDRGSPTKPLDQNRPRAVVVGAGAAGLAAALDLDAGGWEVEVLEAAGRLGGRIMTVRDMPLPNGAVMDVGARTIHPGHVAVTALAERLDVPLVTARRDRPGLDAAICLGRLPQRAATITEQAAVRADLSRVDEAMAVLADPQAANTTDPPLSEVLDRLVDDPMSRALITARVAVDHGADPGLISARQVASRWQSSNAAAQRQVEDGMGALVDALGRALRGHIQMSAPVSEIEVGSSGVVVTHGRGQTQADAAVLAVPAAAARQILIRGAITTDELDMALGLVADGDIASILMVYPAPTWLEDQLDGRILGDGVIGRAVPVAAAVAEGLLIVEAGATQAAELATAADTTGVVKQAIDDCMPVRAFPGGRPAVTVHWSASAGRPSAYPVFGPGWPATATALHQPYGRLYLAGDHTHDRFPGTVEGAVASGQRAAAMILA